MERHPITGRFQPSSDAQRRADEAQADLAQRMAEIQRRDMETRTRVEREILQPLERMGRPGDAPNRQQPEPPPFVPGEERILVRDPLIGDHTLPLPKR